MSSIEFLRKNLPSLFEYDEIPCYILSVYTINFQNKK
jgi:hypothetical protein